MTVAGPSADDATTRAGAIVDAFQEKLRYALARDPVSANELDAYHAAALSVRDLLIDRWLATQRSIRENDPKQVYYLSLEFLLGRVLVSNVINLRRHDDFSTAMNSIGASLETIAEQENDAGLGNGGLGRLAACFLESAATLGIPFAGYGIRYEFGIFRQEISGGEQTELPDAWLQYGNPWEIVRHDRVFPVRFYGHTEEYLDESGKKRVRWTGTSDVLAMAHDILIPGFGNDVVNFLRLWGAKSTRDFDLAKFHAGEYVAAVEDKYRTENISKVLYPHDDQYAGRELRLKQQYFFTSATIQDVIRRFRKRLKRRQGDGHREGVSIWRELPEKVAIQLNDTHPAIAIPELMRFLVDTEALDWDEAWWITERVFSYTNHTVLPEALESWPKELMTTLLPRHVQIIEEIERRFRRTVAQAYPGDESRQRRMAIINDFTGNIRMANLAIVGSHAVNGVAALHTRILQRETFPELHDFFPHKFRNVTNGVTPRRWMLQANPPLSRIIDEVAGAEWPRDLNALRALEPLAEEPAFRARWREMKSERRNHLAAVLRRDLRVEVDPASLFDVQIKRIHEYKRQLMNVMHVIALYHRIAAGEEQQHPRTVIFAGKAFPGYRAAKQIIALIHAVAESVHANPHVRDLLAVHFLPNYDVSLAELLFPATDLSEQISTAGTEASGTGCMKAILNGGVIIGTLDGANVEIRDAVGEENMFIFGHTTEELDGIRAKGYEPRSWIAQSPDLPRVIDTIRTIGGGRFNEIADMLSSSDRYFNCADFDSYMETQRRAAAAWTDQEAWTRMSILNVARAGGFSADRAVGEYAERIWNATPIQVKLMEGREG